MYLRQTYMWAGLIFGLLGWVSFSFAQQANKTKSAASRVEPSSQVAKPSAPSSKPGVVSGRVFAITKGGDLKPARLAKVYLFYANSHIVSVKGRDLDDTPVDWRQGEPAAFIWQRENLKASTDASQYQTALFDQEERRGYPRPAEEVEAEACRVDLRLHGKAIVSMLQWSIDQRKPEQVLYVDADEEGNFKFEVPHRGAYTLVASGRAGLNDAYWELGTDVLVEPGLETTVKVGNVTHSCLDTN